ncbi:hypothetical protein BZG01_19960 [Labilibaculum manganireducens]|uniref:Uncharacterized protein n=1 Tax=Labilibaculum manganireducens TaxID=1940525 RepID=A0A2N3HSP3_9BACT|nr:hypothetical protein BZG01_19960 [Labilibaculum manganireducens]
MSADVLLSTSPSMRVFVLFLFREDCLLPVNSSLQGKKSLPQTRIDAFNSKKRVRQGCSPFFCLEKVISYAKNSSLPLTFAFADEVFTHSAS